MPGADGNNGSLGGAAEPRQEETGVIGMRASQVPASASKIGGGNASLGASGGGGISSNSFRDRLQGLRASRAGTGAAATTAPATGQAAGGLSSSSALQDRLAKVKAQF